MIATLTGVVAEKMVDIVVVDVGGVGYGLYVTNEDHGHLVQTQGVKLYVYEHIREMSHDLFGFVHLDTKRFFEQLLGVNGIGPKMALNVLNIGNVEQVRSAIANGDIKFIQRANGVGKRVAERIIIELKDKVGLISTAGVSDFLHTDVVAIQDEATQALIALGFAPADAAKAMEKIPLDLSLEERVRLALKGGK